MIYEHRLETRTKGLVYGPTILSSLLTTVSPISYKIVIRSREGREVLWVRPFENKNEAGLVYARLIGLEIENYRCPIYLPGIWQDGELEYNFATVTTYSTTANNSGSTWATAGGTACPAGVTKTDYLVVSGGGGSNWGGGGAGGLLTATGSSVTAGTNYPVVVDTGGATHVSGGASSWNSIAPDGGGHGAPISTAGTTGGSGGGGAGKVAGNPAAGGSASGNGTGNAGGTGTTDGATFSNAGAGGGAGAVGGNSTGTNSGNAVSGSGANTGLSNSTSGSAVVYCGGGTGGANAGSIGAAPNGGGGAGSLSAGSAGTAGTGGGAGGDGNGTGAAGGSGVVILSWTATTVVLYFNMPMLGI